MKHTIATLAAFTLALAAPVAAQRAVPSRVPLTIALVEALPVSGGGAFLLKRSPGSVDLLLLRTDATSEQLADGVRTVLVARQAGGDYPKTAGMVRMRPQQARARRDIPWVGRVLADLRRAQPRDVTGVGTVRAVDIYLPRQGRPQQ